MHVYTYKQTESFFRRENSSLRKLDCQEKNQHFLHEFTMAQLLFFIYISNSFTDRMRKSNSP